MLSNSNKSELDLDLLKKNKEENLVETEVKNISFKNDEESGLMICEKIENINK